MVRVGRYYEKRNHFKICIVFLPKQLVRFQGVPSFLKTKKDLFSEAYHRGSYELTGETYQK